MNAELEGQPARRFPLGLLTALAIAYVISPIDLVPDVPPVGWVDDAVVALAALLPHLVRLRRFLRRA